MAKKSRDAARTSIDVDVTPVDQCHKLVICELDRTPGGGGSGHVEDGVIFLSHPGSYQINFRLKNGALGQFGWDSDPFWARRSKCPTTSGMPPQFSGCSVAGDTLTVDADGVPGRSAVHFRLNMTDTQGDPVYCDPIIINT